MTDTTQRDELRERYVDALVPYVRPREWALTVANAVLAVRDKELEELRTAAQYNQDRLAERAEAAENKLTRVRRLHRQSFDICQCCFNAWPCYTIRAMDGDGDD